VVFLQGYGLVYMGSHSALVSDVERRALSYDMAMMFFFYDYGSGNKVYFL